MSLMSKSLIILIEPLTARETEVLDQLAQGDSNAEIGVALYITERTVKTHMNTIFSKLGVHTRLEAVLTAQQMGLISSFGHLSPEALAILALHHTNPHAVDELRANGYF